MYSVSIYKKNVERIDFPSNSEIHGKIKDIKIEKVGNVILEFVPNKGQILKFGEKHFDIENVIIDLDSLKVTLEVKEHIDQIRSSYRCEDIPLVTELI